MVMLLGHDACQVSNHTTRVNTIRKNALVPILSLDKLGEPQQRQLGGLIRRSTRHDDVRTNRRHTENRLESTLGLQEQGDESARDEIRALDVNLPRLPPLLGIALGNRCERLEIPSVVDQDVQSAKLGLDFCGRIFCAVGLGDIEDDAQDLGSVVSGFFCCGLE